jgi:hypothetical protein
MRRIAADVLFVLHLLFGVLLLVGWAFSEYRVWYLIILAVWPLSWIALGYCPFTKWELLLRQKARPELDTSEEFIMYYAWKFFRIRIPARVVYVGGLMLFVVLLVLSLSTNAMLNL